MDIDQLCSEIVAIYSQESDHKLQTEKLRNLLQHVFTSGLERDVVRSREMVRRLVETVVNNESTSMVVSRQFISDIAEHLNQLTSENELVKKLAEVVLNQLNARAIAYEEQSTQIRMNLALAQERDKEFEKAAQTLMGIPLETGQRGYRPQFKMELYLRITELFLEADNIVEADRHVKRASLLQQDVKEDNGAALMLKYNSLYARVLDRQGYFIEAAPRYYDLSLKQGLLSSEKRQMLQNALTCTLLAPPGIQRNRLLNTLFKDERCQSLIGYALMKNMYLERLIKEAELTEFEASLAAHQRLLDSEGASILQRSVLEHNVLAASRLYANISFEGLGKLLGILPKKAEKIATQMISADKVRGSIDQLQGTVLFEVVDSVNSGNARVDAEIASICELTNSINERLASRFPEWHAQRIRAYNNAGAI